MTRRIFGPITGPIIFLLVAALVFAGLGWVTVASLRLEQAQRESAARAELEANLRVALWRLDGRMLPVLGVEDSRPYHHYAGGDFPTVYGPGTAPLLEPDLPGWMRLHFQIDPEEGWSSPQVMPLEEVEHLRGNWPGLSLRNVTHDRAILLRELSQRYPPPQVTATLAARERTIPIGSGPLVNWQQATPVGQPLEQLQPSSPSPQFQPPPTPGAGLPPSPSPQAFKAEVSPEYQAPLARFESGAKQAGQVGNTGDPRQQSVPNTGLSFSPPGIRGVESNVIPESQNRAGILQKGFSDARSASTYPYSQNIQMAPGHLPPGGGLGGVGAGGVALNSVDRKSSNVAGVVPQVRPVNAPIAPQAPSGPPAAPAVIDKSGVAAMRLGGGSAAPGEGGQPKEKNDGVTAFGQTKRSNEAENANPSPTTASVKPGAASGPVAANSPSQDPLRRGSQNDAKQSNLETPRGLFNDFDAALRFRAQQQQTRADDRVTAGPQPQQSQPLQVVPAPDLIPDAIPLTAQPVIHLGSIHPQWLTAADGSDVLVLVRTAHIDHRVVYQGVVLDWVQLESLLRDAVKDLFPDARLVPVKDPATVAPERAMTALPVQLEPGTIPVPPAAGWSPLRFGLALAWVATIIAVVAVGLSSWSLLDLAERRIRFVSAVTHELRTPLTSLRLYLDLLLSGMVQDEDKRREYLATLNVESNRLHRLIDNVLDFARLEGRRKTSDSQPVRVVDVIEQLRETWTDRCAADGKELIAINMLSADDKLHTDPHLVQQIVGNLIDNSRKYTRDAADKRIWVWVKPGTGRRRIVIEVEDRGPGVPTRERAAIFRPFRRGGTADSKAGGAGLGLALAKQWAEMLGGRLSYRPADGGIGACFRLELPGA